MATNERFETGGRVDVRDGRQVVGVDHFAKLVPGILDLVDGGHVGHRAAGRHVGKDDGHTFAAALGWSLANAACEVFGRRYPDQYLRIRYEDLAQDPSAAMQGLFRHVVPGAEWRPEDIGTGDNRHQLYGNRLRARSLSLAEIEEDTAWRTDMSGGARALVAALTLPLRSRYGYR